MRVTRFGMNKINLGSRVWMQASFLTPFGGESGSRAKETI